MIDSSHFLKRMVLQKGDIIQRKGEYDTKVYIVKRGLLRSYSIDEKGREHIFMFAPEGWTIADSCQPETPSDLYIDAIEDSIVVALEKDLERDAPYLEKFIRRLNVLQKRVIMLMSFSARKRYEHFMENYPYLIQRVPQKMIASYLGMTPEALSKIKNNKL